MLHLCVCSLLVTVGVLGEPGWTDPEVVTAEQLKSQPLGTQKLAVSLPATDVWIQAREGEPFSGTNSQCQMAAFYNGSMGWTWQPMEPGVVVDYEDGVWHGVHGRCRLLSPTKGTEAFYLYGEGQKWSFLLKYLSSESEFTCPHNISKFVGIEKHVSSRKLITYTISEKKESAAFCLLSGETSPGCQAVPLTMTARKLSLWNATLASQNMMYCSVMEGACGARLPLFELQGNNNYNYSTAHENTDDGWRQLCWVWSSDHC